MTIQPGKMDLKIFKGAALDETFIIEDQDDYGNSTVVDLTGYTAKAQARETYESSTTFMDLTTENDSITITADEGKIRMYMPASDTEAITAVSGVWDFKLIPPSGSEDSIRQLQGTITISNQVTHT